MYRGSKVETARSISCKFARTSSAGVGAGFGGAGVVVEVLADSSTCILAASSFLDAIVEKKYRRCNEVGDCDLDL